MTKRLVKSTNKKLFGVAGGVAEYFDIDPTLVRVGFVVLCVCFFLLGLVTRPLAFMFSGEMAIAYFYSHQPRTFWPILNLGEDVILFCFVFLYLSAVGGGPWVLDRLYCREKSADT